MLVKDQEQSYTLKLIDFGLAFHRSEAVVGSTHQLPYYRAPEIMLGLPFTEAIDMWSLGAVMGLMMFGNLIFPWFFDYNQMQSICAILGQPADHLLDAGLKTKEFFIKTSNGQWTLKTHGQYWKHKISLGTKKFAFSSLDDLIALSEELESDAEEWKQCVHLLKAMLQVDASKRITPSEVLNHPFITKSYLNEVLQPPANEPSNISNQALTDFRRTEAVTEADDRNQSDQAQYTQGVKNTTFECLSDTLSCETLILDPDPAAASAQDTKATKEIQTLTTEQEDTISDDSKSHKERKKKRKKKKQNTIRCFFSWMKLIFSCCSSVEAEE
ncbi:homeodomain-interacting protein kinase 2 [Lates calcarifer]|uniref:Homeodomain-interacting protein kinase 2 n=1 Tax=Lates calcarifer TaxID=8187 RepID=A0AAJ8B8R6_LATCA|nr:homeodomain-interacting protein kinase 2 [Lates calcarifer]